MAIEKEKFFEIINEVGKSEGLNKDNLLKRIGSELKGIKPGAYSTYNNLKIDKLFMIQDSDKTVNCMLLHLAVECNSVPIVKLLLKKKVKVDEQMSGDVNSKFTALHIAASHGHQEIVQLLLNNNANPSLKDSQGRTPRDTVGDVEGKKAIIKMLEEGEQRYAEAIATRRQTYRQGTLLQPNNKTPGNLVVNGNNVTAAVQAWGAKHKEENSRITPNNRKIYVQDEDEQTSSNSIINGNNTDKVDDTLEREQAIRERDAVAKQLKEAEQRLANNQKRIEQTGHNQHSEQYGATYNGEQTFLNKNSSEDSGICFDADESEALSQSILEDGEDIYAQDENGYTPLHHAAANGDVKNAKSLIDNGEDINAQDENGDTPLHYAAAENYKESAKLLIEHGANVNAQDKAGHTPLYYAVANDNEELAKLLIKYGADRSLIKDEGLIERINRLNSMCGQLSEGASSRSKTNNATKTPEETEKVKKRKVKLKKLCAQLKEENQSLKQKIQDLESEKATLNSELEENENKHSKIKVLLEKAQKELTESKSCIAGHETKLKEFNKENQSLKQKIQELKSKNTTLNSELSKNKANKVEKTQLCFLKVASVNLVTMLTVGVIFSVAFQLPILLMIATSVTSALMVVGVTYALSMKPTELQEVSIQGSMQHDVYKT
ncbi:MAG: ankyrin repeat domain-containing protein [Wolbachia endosymbiont of Homalodisca vitripennis]|nr:ankyrin repeat domain-containing protein [Wolbachia endosymbiont of Homalodisca vitripennis]MCJ7454463.1 ankyrin repeat domain-containing protein [Wolbachia endosymbiont of Homalodisca vitripennis]MCJ7475572.1 ankyrin repeat domain-containing protein [Wolbachia endosymbiont of Homalodisca vitripennis]